MSRYSSSQSFGVCVGCKFLDVKSSSSPALFFFCSGLQEVNENSLKRLNGYLESLQKPGFRSVKPTKLTFYLRDIKGSIESSDGMLRSGKLIHSVNYMSHKQTSFE